MKVIEHLNRAKGKTLFSVEILPPLKGKSIQSIYDILDPIMDFKPSFVDVTYHREEYVYKKHSNGLLEKISMRKSRENSMSVPTCAIPRSNMTIFRICRSSKIGSGEETR